MRAATFLCPLLLACAATPTSQPAQDTPVAASPRPEASVAKATEVPDPAPAAKPTDAPRLGQALHRTRGNVRGGLHVDRSSYVAGAPMLWRFSVENTGEAPIRFRDGGDWYQQGPLHYTWLVRDGAGATECDLRARPEPMAGGGGSSVVALQTGERNELVLVPQTGCAALTRPGNHRLRVVRILTDDGAAPASCSTILVPDTTVTPIDDRGVAVDLDCEAFLLAAPALATEVEIEVLPYDAGAVRTAIAAALADRDEEHRHALGQYAIWLAFQLGREPEWGAEPEVALKSLMAALPATWPGSP